MFIFVIIVYLICSVATELKLTDSYVEYMSISQKFETTNQKTSNNKKLYFSAKKTMHFKNDVVHNFEKIEKLYCGTNKTRNTRKTRKNSIRRKKITPTKNNKVRRKYKKHNNIAFNIIIPKKIKNNKFERTKSHKIAKKVLHIQQVHIKKSEFDNIRWDLIELYMIGKDLIMNLYEIIQEYDTALSK